MVREIDITSAKQVERINLLASKAPYEVWLDCGTVMLDARSLLGLFDLVGKHAKVVVEDDIDPKRFRRLVAGME